MTVPIWFDYSDVIFFHQQCIEEHGGLYGEPRQGTLESILARPQNLIGYNPDTSIFELAACYGFGLARNHCFPDGNKRISLICIDVFLQINGFQLTADEADAVVTIRELAAGELSQEDLAEWIRSHSEHFDLDAE